MLIKLAVAALLFVGWHTVTTFFAPSAEAPTGSLIWPFGKQSVPVSDALIGPIAPTAPPATPGVTIVMALAAIASIGYALGLLGLFGIVVPADLWRPAVAVAAVCSAAVFLVYAGPWAIVPLTVDAVVLMGVFVLGWTQPTLAQS